MAKKSGLGRGYEALLSDNAADEQNTYEIRLSEIEPNPDQPRRQFDPAALEELAENIRQYGLLQPIVVRPNARGSGYQIVAGERRWRACRLAELTTVPVIIKELTDQQTMELALIENLQREDLNPIEEARGYHRLIQEYGLTQEQVAARVGKSRPSVANALRLLELGEYLPLVESGAISAGHGRALLAIKDEQLRKQAVQLIKKGASVRQIEKLAKKRSTSPKPTATSNKMERLQYYNEVELAASEELGRRVKIHLGKTKGTLEIDFYGEQDLADLLEYLFENR